MPKPDLLLNLLKQPDFKFSKLEKYFLEIRIFILICEELTNHLMSQYQGYQQLMKRDLNTEENMQTVKLIPEMINDILLSEEYSLAGIAAYTCVPEEVLYEMAAGINANPTFELCRKLFELHIRVKREMYDEIVQKMIEQYLQMNNPKKKERDLPFHS